MYLEIITFEVREELFEPRCVVKIDSHTTEIKGRLEQLDADVKPLGFKVQFTPVGKKMRKYNNEYEQYGDDVRLYELNFVPRRYDDLAPRASKKKKEKIASISLLFVTILTVYLSAVFYFLIIDPVHGYANNTLAGNIINTVFYMLGAIVLILAHEMGHKLASDAHGIPASMPYLIPGPPPLGMLGAFVKIKDTMSTRDKTFDIALAGIVTGLGASIILVVIGYMFSRVVPTSEYVLLRQDMLQAVGLNTDLNDQYEFISENLNPYNLLMQWIQEPMFPDSTYSWYSVDDYYLPDAIIVMHPIGFGGWLGLYISVINLLPMPILDGGHVFRALFPQKWAGVAGAMIALALTFLFSQYLYFFALIGICSACSRLNKRPSDPDDLTMPLIPLSRGRKLIALLLPFIMLLFVPLSVPGRLFGISA